MNYTRLNILSYLIMETRVNYFESVQIVTSWLDYEKKTDIMIMMMMMMKFIHWQVSTVFSAGALSGDTVHTKVKQNQLIK